VSSLTLAGKLLIAGGVGLVLLGLLMLLLGRSGGPLLPGDLVFQRPGVVFYFPIVTSLVLSVLLTVVLLLIGLLRR
jgi:hypothetical protein